MIQRWFWGLLLVWMGAALWAEDGHRIRLGFLVKQPEESWFQKEWDFAEQAARDLKFDLVKIAATDGGQVLTAIDNLGAQKAAGFVICTPDVKLGPAIVARAQAWGMKVFVVDDQLLNSDGTPLRSVPYLGISAREIGMEVAAVCWAELLHRRWDLSETGAIAISFNELETARARLAGTTTLLDAMGLAPGNIFDAPQKTTDVEGGFNAANVTITKNPRIKHWLVFALNDESVLGGVQALQGRGFQAFDVIGVGINGMAIAASELRKTTATGFFGSILLDARRHGYETISMLYRWARDGVEPPMDTRTKGTVITRDNYVAVLTAHGLEGLLK